MTFFTWSRTASANASADSTINWAEGQAPSTVNNSARAEMAALAKFRDDLGGSIASGGTVTAYTATSYQGFASSSANLDGFLIGIEFHAANGLSPTLSVGGRSGAILAPDMVAPRLYQIRALSRHLLSWDSGSSLWVMMGALPPAPGDEIFRYGTGTLPGWVRENGGTIGPAGSGATERANADTYDLYRVLWGQAGIAITGGAGASADADWGAGKTLTLPDARGRVLAGVDQMGAASAAGRLTSSYMTSPDALGSAAGAQSHTLTTTEIAHHTHTGATSTNGNHNHGNGFVAQAGGSGGGSFFIGSQVQTGNAGDHNHSFTTDGTGGGGAHNNLQPTTLRTIYIKL